MTALERIREAYPDDEFLFPEGFEDCVIGLAERNGMSSRVILLDKDKVLEKLESRDVMTSDEADEFFEYNILGAWLGEYTPCFCEIYSE